MNFNDFAKFRHFLFLVCCLKQPTALRNSPRAHHLRWNIKKLIFPDLHEIVNYTNWSIASLKILCRQLRQQRTKKTRRCCFLVCGTKILFPVSWRFPTRSCSPDLEVRRPSTKGNDCYRTYQHFSALPLGPSRPTINLRWHRDVFAS